MRHRLLFLGQVLWASPYSLFGMLVGVLGLCTGGKMRRRGRAIEFHGGAVTSFVRRLPAGDWVRAITFGHTILGRNAAALDVCREHEWVHVRQYERWGPLLGPAYLACSLVLWMRGKQAYRDNPFEREAYGDDEY